MTDDVFAIYKYVGWTANKRQVYGIRGIGPTYNAFWQTFSKNYKTTWEYDDWPWSYIAIDEDNEQKFLKEFESHISEQIDEDHEPYDSVLVEEQKPIDPDTVLLFKILNEEIQKEINKEVINQICENVKVK